MINNRSEHVAPAKGAERLVDVSKELAELGSIKEGLVSEIARLQKLAEDYNGIDEKMAIKEKELADLNASVFSVTQKVAEQAGKLLVVDNLKEQRAELESEIKKLNVEFITVKEEISASKESFDLSAKEIGQEIIELGNIKKDQEYSIKSLQSQVSELAGLIEGLKINKDLLEREVEDLEKFGTKISNQIKDDDKKLLELRVELEKIKNDKSIIAKKIIEDATNEAEKIMQDASDYKDKIDKAIVDKQGELSDKAKFLQVREDFLKSIKEQLEDKLGKKIDNLVF